MNIQKLNKNPEIKRITWKYIIISCIAELVLILASVIVTNRIDVFINNQNIHMFADVIQEKGMDDIISNYYEKKDNNEIEEAKNILKEYGYIGISHSANELREYVNKVIAYTFISIGIIFLVIIYFFYLKELKKIYSSIENIKQAAIDIVEGKDVNITTEYNEGELSILSNSLNLMNERVNNSIELLKNEKINLKEFLSDISHQLKTPLASLVMFNDLLAENENMSYEDRVKFLKLSQEQLTRMEWLIMNLLKVGRLEADAIEFKLENQNIGETIDLAVSSLREMAHSKSQELIISGDTNCEFIHDKKWLAEALSNIIKNSIEHTQEGGLINIDIEEGKLINRIIISDNGEGIPKELINKIFKRFYKGSSSVNPTSIGIGLSLSKSIIEKQHGEIKVTSEEGKGTIFTISFIK